MYDVEKIVALYFGVELKLIMLANGTIGNKF